MSSLPAAPSPPTVVLEDPESASGLADMLHQFVEQTVADSERKAAVARDLRGAVVVRALEDRDVAVHIAFLGDRIELRDVAAHTPANVPTIVGGFLAVAHVTSGKVSPLRAVLTREIVVRAGLSQLPFMLRLLGFMRIPSAKVAPVPNARFVFLALLLLLALASALAWLYWKL